MVFTPITVVNGSTPMNATWGNNAQTQYSEAMLSFQADLITGFVEAGFVATKDGSIANQLDVTSGSAYIQQSDFTKRLHSNSSTTFTTVTPSSTYHLYIQPDGTFYWNTANTPATGSLFIAQVTTDGSGNILAVTDERNINPTLLPNLSGELILPNVTLPTIGGQASAGSFGAPVIVAQTLALTVSATTDQTVLLYTGAAIGLYRASMHFTYRNGTAQKPVANVHFFDHTLSTFSINFFRDGLDGFLLNGSQSASPGTNQSLACESLTFFADSTQGMGIHFQDGGGTPNDVVTAIIERLA